MKTSFKLHLKHLVQEEIGSGSKSRIWDLEVLKDFLCPGTFIKFSPHFMAPCDLCDVDLAAAAISWGVFSKIVWVYKLTVQP